MAGSYRHVTDGGWGLIEHMGDAVELTEELLFLVLSLRESESQVAQLLEEFYAIRRGDRAPTEVYAETMRLMYRVPERGGT